MWLPFWSLSPCLGSLSLEEAHCRGGAQARKTVSGDSVPIAIEPQVTPLPGSLSHQLNSWFLVHHE